MPYRVHEETYAASPLFIWQPPTRAPEYRHPIMARFWTGWVRILYETQRTLSGLLWLTCEKVTQLLSFYLGIWLLLVVIVNPRSLLRDRWVCLCETCGLLLAVLLQVLRLHPALRGPGDWPDHCPGCGRACANCTFGTGTAGPWDAPWSTGLFCATRSSRCCP